MCPKYSWPRDHCVGPFAKLDCFRPFLVLFVFLPKCVGVVALPTTLKDTKRPQQMLLCSANSTRFLPPKQLPQTRLAWLIWT